ncbi:MAG: hypothetical protein AB1349_11955 [Elusimicrobiota bacterium]
MTEKKGQLKFKPILLPTKLTNEVIKSVEQWLKSHYDNSHLTIEDEQFFDLSYCFNNNKKIGIALRYIDEIIGDNINYVSYEIIHPKVEEIISDIISETYDVDELLILIITKNEKIAKDMYDQLPQLLNKNDQLLKQLIIGYLLEDQLKLI